MPDVKVVAVDPYVDSHEALELRSIEDGLDDIDIVVLLVPHRQFHKMPIQMLREKIVFDVCGMFVNRDKD